MRFTQIELDYVARQKLGRLATVDPQGAPQNNPVGFRYNAELDTIDISGRNMGTSRKFRNIQANPRVSLVIDDIFSIDPWRVRGIEIRGDAVALNQAPAQDHLSAEIIRIRPRRIITWGLVAGTDVQQKRNVD